MSSSWKMNGNCSSGNWRLAFAFAGSWLLLGAMLWKRMHDTSGTSTHVSILCGAGRFGGRHTFGVYIIIIVIIILNTLIIIFILIQVIIFNLLIIIIFILLVIIIFILLIFKLILAIILIIFTLIFIIIFTNASILNFQPRLLETMIF